MDIVTEYPSWFFILCLLIGLGFAFFLYQKRNPDLSKIVHYTLFAIRFVLVSLLCFFLLGPLLKSTSTFTEKPILVIAADNSASLTKNRDSAVVKAGLSSALKKIADQLEEKYEVKFLKFSSEAEEDTALTFAGKETNIASALEEIRSNYEGRNLGAVILASDGLYNTGNNPLYEVEKGGFPVYTIALGDTLVKRDAYIKKIVLNPSAYIGNQFPVEVQIQAGDLPGKSAEVSISQNGRKLSAQTLKYTSSNHNSVLNFLLNAEKAGLQRYEVNLSFNEGEQNKSNNTSSFVIEVIDKREKILLLANAPHPDINALKSAIEANQSYEVDVKLAENFTGSLKPYSLLIIHQVELKHPLTKKLVAEMAAHKTPVWQIARNDLWAFAGLRLGNISSRQNEAEPLLNPGFGLFNVSTNLRNYLKELPAVACPLANYKMATGAVALINQQIGQVQTENPILVFADEGGQKSALFCGEGLWRWRLRDYADHENNEIFDELIQKTVQYLSVKADKSFFKVYTRRLLSENEIIEFDAEVFNPSYELITEPEVNMIITDEAKKQFTYTFSKTNSGYHLNAGNFPAGSYTFKAQVKTGDKVFEQSGSFNVKPLLVEFTGQAADHALLYNISKRSGGEMVYLSETGALVKRLLENENIKTLVHEQRQVNDLINLRALFFILLVLLSIEWFVRKYSGLY